jgi:hypothetical protein
MNADTSSGRIALHLAALAHRPGHFAFHARGIAREVPQTATFAVIAAIGWMVAWFLILI